MTQAEIHPLTTARSDVAKRDAGPKGGAPAIVVREVSKTFKIPAHRPSTLKERALHPFRRIPGETIDAADRISFEVGDGEFFGIVGRNGSGKSTMLRMLAGIYRPDSGEIAVRGRISPFIELGVGFNMEMKARDNVIINGTMLGLPRATIKRRVPEIMDFAGLEGFEDLALKNYSSGMLVRLAFATAIQVDADVLLLDEVLAVGDANFQEKCFDEFRRLKREGRTIILVTHAMDAVRRFCDRAMLMDSGSLVAIGDASHVAEAYRASSMEEAALVPITDADGQSRFGDRSAEVLDCWVEDAHGERRTVIDQGDRFSLCVSYRFTKDAPHPVLGIQVQGEAKADVLAINTDFADYETPRFGVGDEATMRISLEAPLGVGVYSMTPAVASRDATRMADIRFHLATFRVDGMRRTGAAIDPGYELSVERDP